MTFLSRFRIVVPAVVLACMVAGSPAVAADISESHLKASLHAVAALRITDQFDSLLPQTAQALQSELIQKNPDVSDLISEVVQTKTLEMVARRADLEKEVATVYANAFTEAELNDIAAFYEGATGKKLIAEGPIATRETLKAVDIWQRGMARDLAEAVGKELQARVPAPTPAPAAEEKPK